MNDTYLHRIVFSQQTLVDTLETTRLRYFLDLLVDKKKAIMFIGAAGTGKSVIINDKLKSLPNELFAVATIPLNYYTTSGKTFYNDNRLISTNCGFIYIYNMVCFFVNS